MSTGNIHKLPPLQSQNLDLSNKTTAPNNDMNIW